MAAGACPPWHRLCACTGPRRGPARGACRSDPVCFCFRGRSARMGSARRQGCSFKAMLAVSVLLAHFPRATAAGEPRQSGRSQPLGGGSRRSCRAGSRCQRCQFLLTPPSQTSPSWPPSHRAQSDVARLDPGVTRREPLSSLPCDGGSRAPVPAVGRRATEQTPPAHPISACNSPPTRSTTFSLLSDPCLSPLGFTAAGRGVSGTQKV